MADHKMRLTILIKFLLCFLYLLYKKKKKVIHNRIIRELTENNSSLSEIFYQLQIRFHNRKNNLKYKKYNCNCKYECI